MNIAIVNELEGDEQDDPLEPGPLAQLAELVMREEALPSETQLTIALVDEGRIAELNEMYMGKQGPTDVLSFPIEALSPGSPPVRLQDGPPVAIGDIVICPSVVQRNAFVSGVAFSAEMALMVVHGVLHLLGWDHEIDEEAEAMESRERTLLASVGMDRP